MSSPLHRIQGFHDDPPATPNQTPLTVKLRRPGGRFLVGEGGA